VVLRTRTRPTLNRRAESAHLYEHSPPRQVMLRCRSSAGSHRPCTETGELCAEALQRPYHALAHLLNCDADEIAITQSATSAWQAAGPHTPPLITPT
jgi:hypothetical protein